MIAGFRRFREKYFSGEDSVYTKLAEIGQSPKTLIIGCSDSRVDPALITGASPGELFTVRNVANLVPPYEADYIGRHGVSAAIEFAVVNLKVENIIILGHRQCGGIRALMSGPQQKAQTFIGMWMEILAVARERVLKEFSHLDFENQCRECELEAIAISIKNLKGFPFVKDAITEREMNIYGIYFDLEQGSLMEFDEATEKFQTLKI
jgi:carbonic anhydrase